MPCQEAEGSPPKVHWEKVLSNLAGPSGLTFPPMSFWTDMIEFSLENFQEHRVKISFGLAPRGFGGEMPMGSW